MIKELQTVISSDETKKLALLQDDNRYEVRTSFYTPVGYSLVAQTFDNLEEAEEYFNYKKIRINK